MALSFVLAILLVVSFFVHRVRRSRLLAQLAECRQRVEDIERQASRQAGEAALRQERLFDQMVESVLILDGEGQVVLANRELRRLFGLSDEAQGLPLMSAIRSHELKEIVEEAVREGQVTGRELVTGSGNESRFFNVNVSSYEDGDGESGAIVVLHDMTQLRQIETGRREFVANVSHELRTPLSMIKGYVETLQGGEIDDPMIEARFLGKIRKHSDRLTYLIEDLLALSQLESQQIALSFARVPIATLAQRVVDDLQDRASDRGVTLVNEIPKDLILSVDPDRLQQVFQNLIDNGIKYGKTEGRVSVTARDRGDGFVEVNIADDGAGIPVEAHDRVFERFFRVDKARSREQGGTGLGLAIVKHIIQSHGGEVWLTSANPGACFNFTLPLNPEVVHAA